MKKNAVRPITLIKKIESLTPDKLVEVEDFVDFLRQREDREITRAMTKLAEKSFHKVWDNPEDAAYDRL